MSRGVRVAVGSVVAGTLLLVAVVAGVIAVASAGPGWVEDEWLGGEPDSSATAEVLDVDDELDWVSIDIRWTTDSGEVVVTWIDWVDDELPAVGDTVEIVYDSDDPEYAVYAADDPFLDELTGEGPAVDDDSVPGGTSGVGEAAGWLALGALVLLVPTVLVTVVAAVLAPGRPAAGGGPTDPFAWQPGRPSAPTAASQVPQGFPVRPSEQAPPRTVPDQWSNPT